MTAITYLGASNDEKVVSLRERLYVALGQKPQVQDVRHQQPSRRGKKKTLAYNIYLRSTYYFSIGSQRTSFSNYPAPTNTFSASTNPFHSSQQNQFNTVPQPIAAQVPPPAFNSNQFNTALPNPSVNAQPWQVPPNPVGSFNQQPPKPFSPAPPLLTQPPRPTSVGSAQGTSHNKSTFNCLKLLFCCFFFRWIFWITLTKIPTRPFGRFESIRRSYAEPNDLSTLSTVLFELIVFLQFGSV